MTQLDAATTYAAYAPAGGTWMRSNMVMTLDGAATGADGRSGSINNPADQVVFEALRAWAHAVVVGAGTLRAEGYTPIAVDDQWRGLREEQGLPPTLPLVAVGNSGSVPPRLREVRDGSVLLATHAGAPGLADARASLGEDNVVVCGDGEVDLAALVGALHERGLTQLLTEGGPSLLASMLDAHLLDELCFTIVPAVVGGAHRRPLGGVDLSTDVRLEVLVEEGGTLLGRWFTSR
jgi:riboflavin biosynthesis pyrimidine reductase